VFFLYFSSAPILFALCVFRLKTDSQGICAFRENFIAINAPDLRLLVRITSPFPRTGSETFRIHIKLANITFAPGKSSQKVEHPSRLSALGTQLLSPAAGLEFILYILRKLFYCRKQSLPRNGELFNGYN